MLNFDVENGHVNTEVNSWSKWGGVQWEIAGALLLAWIIISAVIVKGVQSYGKVGQKQFIPAKNVMLNSWLKMQWK